MSEFIELEVGDKVSAGRDLIGYKNQVVLAGTKGVVIKDDSDYTYEGGHCYLYDVRFDNGVIMWFGEDKIQSDLVVVNVQQS